jgi:molybdate transport system substrate-binding protein
MIRRGLSSLLVAIVGVILFSGCVSTTPAPDTSTAAPSAVVVSIAAAADLKFALEDIAVLIEEQAPSLDLQITYGSSGTFLQQIQNGAPFDLYLSADLSYPQQLVDRGYAQEADLFPYAVGRLVLWVPEGSSLDPAAGLPVLLDTTVQRLSIANPEHAPYGRAAIAALQTAGVYDEVESKFVLGENIAQAAEYVQSGNADAGIVALSLVLSDPLADAGEWLELPLDTYPRLDQGGVVISNGENPEGARLVRDVLLSDAGTEIMARYGFALPGI